MMDPLRKVDANRKYFSDALFHALVDNLVGVFEAGRLKPWDIQLALELAVELQAVAAIGKVSEGNQQR